MTIETVIDPMTALIAKQNDEYRAALPVGGSKTILGQTVTTQGVAALGLEFVVMATLAVAGFAAFTEDNDPHGLHDFGALELFGERIFWKIDLYDADYRYGSETPENLDVTRRVLTIMLPSEY